MDKKKLNKKPKTVNFYHLDAKKEVLNDIDRNILDTYSKLKGHRSNEIETIDIRENKYYIYSMDKAYVDSKNPDNYAWLLTLSKLDPTAPIEIDDLSKNIENRNEMLPTEDSKGQVINTQFLYDVNTHVCAFARTSGGVNKALFKTFLLRFCNVRGLKLSIIPDEIAISRLDTLVKPSCITYSIAKINNLSSIAKKSQDEIKDIEYADDVGASEMTVMLKTDGSMKRPNIISKAKFLFSNSEDLGIKKLELEGINDDGVFEPVDLVQHKLTYHGSVEYENVITIKNMFAFLEQAYFKKYDYLTKYFK